MKLNNLTIKYFKKIKSLSIDFKDGNNSIIGANSAGKSTVFDAYCFLLFGKDHHGDGPLRFGIKTHDEDGEEYPNVQHEVTGTFTMADGKELILKRVFKEVHIRIRGTNKFNVRNTTDYFINTDTSSERDYNNYVESLIGNAEMFKILSDANYFCSDNIHWTERRKILMNLASKQNIQEMILKLKKFDVLADEIRESGIDTVLSRYKAKKKEADKQLDEIPIRIDEIYNSMSELDVSGHEDFTEDEIDVEKAKVKNDMVKTAKNKEIAYEVYQKANAKYYDDQMKLAGIDNEMYALVGKETRKHDKLIREHKNKISNLEQERRITKQKAGDVSLSLENEKESKIHFEDMLFSINMDIEKAEQRKFTIYDSDTKCNFCGQELPNRDNIVSELESKFNKTKELEINQLQHSLEINIKKITQAENNIESSKNDYAKLLDEYSDIKDKVEKAYELLNDLENYDVIPSEIAGYKYLEEIKENILSINAPKPFDSSKYDNETFKLSNKLSELQQARLNIQSINKSTLRLNELQSEQSICADNVTKYEQMIILCEDYIMRSAKMKESSINKLFKNVSFKLFDIQQNGGIKECCIPISNGSVYNGWGQSQRAIAGVEVIEVLSDLQGVKVPVWVEDAGIIFNLKSDKLQLIQLVAVDGAELKIN